MSERLSLDPRSYIGQETSGRLAVNLADIALEAGKGTLEKRINPFKLVVEDGKVINPELGSEDVWVYYNSETELEKKETKAAIEIRHCLLNKPDGTLAVWLSPPNPKYDYQEGRITVGYNCTLDGIKTMKSYGIAVDSFTPEQFLSIGLRLAESTEDGYHFLNEPEDLRSTPIIFPLPENEYPWDYLEKFIPLPAVWERIKSGEAEQKRQEVSRDAEEIAPEVQRKIQNAESFYGQIEAIRWAERQMAERGHKIDDSKLTCSILVLSTTTPYQHIHTAIGTSGEVKGLMVSSGEAKYVKNCGKCGRTINKKISAGYRCICGGIYKGC